MIYAPGYGIGGLPGSGLGGRTPPGTTGAYSSASGLRRHAFLPLTPANRGASRDMSVQRGAADVASGSASLSEPMPQLAGQPDTYLACATARIARLAGSREPLFPAMIPVRLRRLSRRPLPRYRRPPGPVRPACLCRVRARGLLLECVGHGPASPCKL